MFGASKRSRSLEPPEWNKAVMRNPSLEEEDIMRSMESSDTRSIVQQSLLPGFRFHPTDAELVGYYLKKKVQCGDSNIEVIALVDIYKYHPSDLPKIANFGEDEWYFFTPRARKYPKGKRPKRTAERGFWKATGTDKVVVDGNSRELGVKKSLVFYTGNPKPGNSSKTNWIMHEYRLAEGMAPTAAHHSPNSNQLDDLVLCRIYQKKSSSSAQAAASQEHDLDSMIAELDDQIRASESATHENDVVDSVQQTDSSTSIERTLALPMSMTMSNFCNSTFGNPAATSSWNNHNQMLSFQFNQLVQGLPSQQPLGRLQISQFHDTQQFDSNRDVASSSTQQFDSNTDVASSSTHSPIHNLTDDILFAPIYYEDGAMDSFSYVPDSFC